jgi:DNA-binding XRE family transcriptional regulator
MASIKAMCRHLAELRDGDLEPDTLAVARQLLLRLRVPMEAVLAKVPGESIAAKAREIGVTRATYYKWAGGICRPGWDQAEQLAKLTKYTPEEIHGGPQRRDE